MYVENNGGEKCVSDAEYYKVTVNSRCTSLKIFTAKRRHEYGKQCTCVWVDGYRYRCRYKYIYSNRSLQASVANEPLGFLSRLLA